MSKNEIKLEENMSGSGEQTDTLVSEDTEIDTEAVSAAEDTEEEDAESDADLPQPEKKVLFMKAAQGYGMIFGFGIGYILSGILSEMGLPAGKFECVILCMFAGIIIGSLSEKFRK